MIPTNKILEFLLEHLGEEWGQIQESLQSDPKSKRIARLFGRMELPGAVLFVDMRDFSRMSNGKSPRKIAQLVRPFVNAVIMEADDNDGFIDKTVGDEVMIMFPDPDDRLEKVGVELPKIDGWVRAMNVLRRLHERLTSMESPPRFSAGLSWGPLWVERIGVTGRYQEWTCYGQSVNVAARVRAHFKNHRTAGRSVIGIGLPYGELEEAPDRVRTARTLALELWGAGFQRVGVQAFVELPGVGKTTSFGVIL